MIKVTYKKKNGDIIVRIRNTYCPYKIGAKTSMGWTVLDIQYKWKDKYYSRVEYDMKIDRAYKIDKKINFLKRQLYRFYKESVYVVILLIFVNKFIKM